MPYCTRTQLETACGGADSLTQLADQNGDSAEDPGVIDQVMTDAAGLIDSYASKRFAVPMPTSPTLAAINARIARYYLRDARMMLTQADVAGHESDVKWLKSLADGEVLPGVEPLPGKSQISRDAATQRPESKEVSRSKLKGYW